MCAYSHASLEWRFSTKVAIPDKAWSKKAQAVKATSPDAGTINGRILEPLRNELRQIALEIQARPDPLPPTPDRVRRRFEKSEANSDFWRRFSEFEEGRVASLAANTQKNYRHLRAFLKEIEAVTGPMSWRVFDLQFYELFRHQLRKRGNSENTISKRVANLKAFLRYAHRAGWHDNDSFQYFETAREKTKHVALSEHDLRRVREMEPETEGQARARDVFLFQCYVGCRFSDLSRIEYQGGGRIRFRSQKTKVDQALEVSSVARKIVEKYEGALPVVSVQKYNKHIKRICRAAGVASWRECTSHTARRTCATILWRKGVDLRRIQSVLGHSSIKQTEQYLKATEADFETTLTRFDEDA